MIASGIAIASRAVSSSSAPRERTQITRFQLVNPGQRCCQDRVLAPVGRVVASRQRDDPRGSEQKLRSRPDTGKIGKALDDAVVLHPHPGERRDETTDWEHARQGVHYRRQPRRHIERVRADLEIVGGESRRFEPGAPGRRLRQGGDRPGLKDVELPVRPGPLDILRPPEVLGDRRAHARQLQQNGVRQRGSRRCRSRRPARRHRRRAAALPPRAALAAAPRSASGGACCGERSGPG